MGRRWESGVVHPQGLAPPDEWLKTGRTSSAEFRQWMDTPATGKPSKRPKYGQKAGRRPDLGNLYLKSELEANTLRLLVFLGYELWLEKGQTPPASGRYVAYEWQRFRLVADQGKPSEHPVVYVPDCHLWDDGRYSLWEAKGCFDARSKRLLRLMEEQLAHIPLTVITAPELEVKKTEALLRARRERNDPSILDIPGWE